ncbi:MAG: GTP-binding protein [Clostridia bacterium]|nr:GTP-binding protein [Clostridia bacterium]
MTKADIFSGFLGAGKTTLIKKLVNEAFDNEKLVIIENEFGEIGIDSGFLSEAGVNVTEMNSGCICCSLVGDFGKALTKVLDDYSPDRILIEPSGVGKLSDVIKAVENAGETRLSLDGAVAVIDAKKCKVYMKNFGEFFNNQIEHAKTIVLSHTAGLSDEKIAESVKLIREHNEDALIVTTDWNELDGKQLLETIERSAPSLSDELKALEDEARCPVCGEHHHHHHDHDEECECHHHHHDHDEECECHHHHHDHDEECECHHHHHDHDEECECHHHHHDHDEECECHHHHHDHDEECECHHHHHDHDEECECHHHHHDHDEECECHHHHHDHDEECECHHHHHDHDHHHHHADEVFTSWGKESARKYTKDELESILSELDNTSKYGYVLRAKGYVAGDGCWYYFDFTPEDPDIRTGSPAPCGRFCVIGSKINTDALEELFR